MIDINKYFCLEVNKYFHLLVNKQKQLIMYDVWNQILVLQGTYDNTGQYCVRPCNLM